MGIAHESQLPPVKIKPKSGIRVGGRGVFERRDQGSNGPAAATAPKGGGVQVPIVAVEQIVLVRPEVVRCLDPRRGRPSRRGVPRRSEVGGGERGTEIPKIGTEIPKIGIVTSAEEEKEREAAQAPSECVQILLNARSV